LADGVPLCEQQRVHELQAPVSQHNVGGFFGVHFAQADGRFAGRSRRGQRRRNELTEPGQTKHNIAAIHE
jgi:hypothetical protein